MKTAITMISSLLLAMLIGSVPAFAISEDSRDLDRFLQGIGWDKTDYVNYLDSKEWSLDEFDFVDELGTPLTEAQVSKVLNAYDLTRTELNSLLQEYGDLDRGEDVLEGTYLIFAEDLDATVDFYLSQEQDLTPITDAGLAALLSEYGFSSKEELEAFLQTFDDSLSDYRFLEDLESSIIFYQEDWSDIGFDDFFSELGLTEQELERLFEHFETLDYNNPAFEQRLENLSERMMAIDDFTTITELSAEQIAELLSIYDELMDLFEMKAQYYFVKGDEKKEISIQSLITLESTDGYDLLIEFYNLQGEFLADILLTSEMFGSDLIIDAGEDLIGTPVVVAPPTKPSTTIITETDQTVKGGKLPKTASNFATNAGIGLGFILFGTLLLMRKRIKRAA